MPSYHCISSIVNRLLYYVHNLNSNRQTSTQNPSILLYVNRLLYYVHNLNSNRQMLTQIKKWSKYYYVILTNNVDETQVLSVTTNHTLGNGIITDQHMFLSFKEATNCFIINKNNEIQFFI